MTDFTAFIETWGEPQHASPAGQEVRSAYEKALPADLLEFWDRYGFAGFGCGLIWVIDPRQLEDVLHRWPLPERGRAIPVIRTALGDIIFFRANEYWLLKVHYNETFEAASDADGLFSYYLISEISRRSVLLEKEFKAAKKKLGDLSPDEVYGFVLPLALGGDRKVSNMDKVKLREHLAILADVHRQGS